MEQKLLEKIKNYEDEILLLKTQLQNTKQISTARSFAESNKLDTKDGLLFYLKTALGYSVKQQGNTIVLRSVYSFAMEDTFELEIQNNKLALKQTNYLNEWTELLDIYIKNGKSFSAFFAAVTLELYNRKTFG